MNVNYTENSDLIRSAATLEVGREHKQLTGGRKACFIDTCILIHVASPDA